MRPKSDFDDLFDHWLQSKRKTLEKKGPIPFGPEVIEPGIGNQRYIDTITSYDIVVREVSATSLSRNKTFRYPISEIRSNFRQMFEDPEALGTRPKSLYYKYTEENRTIKLLIEFKYDMFRDFMGL